MDIESIARIPEMHPTLTPEKFRTRATVNKERAARGPGEIINEKRSLCDDPSALPALLLTCSTSRSRHPPEKEHRSATGSYRLLLARRGERGVGKLHLMCENTLSPSLFTLQRLRHAMQKEKGVLSQVGCKWGHEMPTPHSGWRPSSSGASRFDVRRSPGSPACARAWGDPDIQTFPSHVSSDDTCHPAAFWKRDVSRES